MQASDSDARVVSRRALWFSLGLGLALLLAIGAFFALRGRVTPLWLTERPAQTTPP